MKDSQLDLYLYIPGTILFSIIIAVGIFMSLFVYADGQDYPYELEEDKSGQVAGTYDENVVMPDNDVDRSLPKSVSSDSIEVVSISPTPTVVLNYNKENNEPGTSAVIQTTVTVINPDWEE